MQRNTKRIIGKGVVCLLCFLLGGVATLGITWHLLGQDGGPCSRPISSLKSGLWGSMTRRRTSRATLETMVDSLGDRWSYYLDPEEASRTREARSNAYVGIGVTVSQEPSDGLEIVGVTAGSPAQEAGLQVGEIIRRRGRPGHPAGDPGGGGGGHQGGGGHLAHPGGGGPPTAPAGRWSSSGNRSMGSPPPGSCWRTMWGW